MDTRFALDVLWQAREDDYDAAKFSRQVQACCVMLADVDGRFVKLTRNGGKKLFAQLPPGRAAQQARKDARVVGLLSFPPGDHYATASAAGGTLPHSPGSFTTRFDDHFWRDEDLIRRVAAELIDFWRADQWCVYSLTLGRTYVHKAPWHFWLDWRRTPDQPTLLPDVVVAGQPSVTREWHGGTERIWPEHAPWDHVGKGTAA